MTKKKPPRLLNNQEIQLIKAVTQFLRNEFHLYDVVQSDLYDSYFVEAIRQNRSEELITHQGGDWVDTIMNFRDGATTVIGTLCEYVAHLAYLRAGHSVVPLYKKEYQLSDRDFLIDNVSYSSIKKNHLRENGKVRMGWDYFEHNSPELSTLVFVDPFTCLCYEYNIKTILPFFKERRSNLDNGFFYERPLAIPSCTILEKV